VEKSQYDLCIEVLRRLDKAGILKDLVLVGSWCTLFYKDFFGGKKYMTSLTTRDMDLLIPVPRAIKVKADVAELLKDLGFIVGFTGSQGYIRLEHPQLIVEFLVPERGRSSDKPYSLPQLGLNAQALRFLEYLSANTITSKIGSTKLKLPHPANFALHKLVVMGRRPKADKQAKDKESAIRILNALINSDQSAAIKKAFQAMPKRWQGKVKKQLTDITEEKIIEVLETQ
jgi:hypothetical protein